MRFADTSFWFALQVPDDRNHLLAAALARTGRSTIVTTNHVVGETWTLMRRRGNHRLAVAWLDLVAQLPGLEVVQVDDVTEELALAWLRQHDEREYSFVDATSFAVMRKRRITEGLAFHGDFTAAGFTELR